MTDNTNVNTNANTNTNANDESKQIIIPKIIFIIPYRDRKYQMNIFRIIMKNLLEDYDPAEYEIYFSHQNDKRPFNRGAIKNIGFKAIKDKYPNDYKNITLVFNDVDTVPCEKGLINYQTTQGVIKHFYGVDYALGGIFSITGNDFEMLNGFPCYWSWGYEDNVLNTRANNMGLTIDRSVFFKIGDYAILQSVDNFVKIVNRKHKIEMYNDNLTNGLSSIHNISYEIIEGINQSEWIINVNNFEPVHKLEHEQHKPYNLMTNKYIGRNNISYNYNSTQTKNQILNEPIDNQSNTNHANHANKNQNEHLTFSFNLMSKYNPNNANNNKNIMQQNNVLQAENEEIRIQQLQQKKLEQSQNAKQILLQRHKFIRRGGLAFMK